MRAREHIELYRACHGLLDRLRATAVALEAVGGGPLARHLRVAGAALVCALRRQDRTRALRTCAGLEADLALAVRLLGPTVEPLLADDALRRVTRHLERPRPRRPAQRMTVVHEAPVTRA